MNPEDIPDGHFYAFARPFLPDPILEMWIRLAEHAAIRKDEAVKAGEYTLASELFEFTGPLKKCAKDYCKLFGRRKSGEAEEPR
jgi:hypothetical protein